MIDALSLDGSFNRNVGERTVGFDLLFFRFGSIFYGSLYNLFHNFRLAIPVQSLNSLKLVAIDIHEGLYAH